MTTKPWGSTPVSVLQNTGVDVSSGTISMAASMIEIYAGIIGLDLSKWSAVRLSWLARATDWQAAFIYKTPDLFNLGVYKSLKADDVQQVFADRGMIDLDKRAIHCLVNIGGQARVRSLRMRGALGMLVGESSGSLDEDSEPDGYLEWQSLDEGN